MNLLFRKSRGKKGKKIINLKLLYYKILGKHFSQNASALRNFSLINLTMINNVLKLTMVM